MKARHFALGIGLCCYLVSPIILAISAPPAPLSETQSILDKINLNKASVSTLKGSFRGIGKKRAEAIVNYRKTHGEYRSVMELGQVRGISMQFVRRHLTQLQAVFSVS